MFPILEFEKLANIHDGKRRSDAFTRWSQVTALAVGYSLWDIEAILEA